MIDPFAKFNQIWAALVKAGCSVEFEKHFTNIKEAGIESKNDVALGILRAHGVIEFFNESGGFDGFTFTEVAPRHIPKKNGAGGTISEANAQLTEVDRRTVAKKEALVESVMRASNLTEIGARAALGLSTKAPEGLKGYQLVEYNNLRRCGFSEADSLKAVKRPLNR
jgi:hypothetical protein